LRTKMNKKQKRDALDTHEEENGGAFGRTSPLDHYALSYILDFTGQIVYFYFIGIRSTLTPPHPFLYRSSRDRSSIQKSLQSNKRSMVRSSILSPLEDQNGIGIQITHPCSHP